VDHAHAAVAVRNGLGDELPQRLVGSVAAEAVQVDLAGDGELAAAQSAEYLLAHPGAPESEFLASVEQGRIRWRQQAFAQHVTRFGAGKTCLRARPGRRCGPFAGRQRSHAAHGLAEGALVVVGHGSRLRGIVSGSRTDSSIVRAGFGTVAP
jgi:hypothetical protein